MEDSGNSVRVSIFGDEYSIKGSVDQNTTRAVAEYVSSKMNEMQRQGVTHNKLRTAILTSLNIAGELFEMKAKLEKIEMKIADFQKNSSFEE